MRALSSGVAACCAAGLLLACNEDSPPPEPARFDRPNSVAFVCVNQGSSVPLDNCRPGAGDGLSLFALVTQSARGEIAAVNLATRRVIDNRRDIPGYTFVPVGEMPVAAVVPPNRPALTYVADYGSRDLRLLQTDALVAPVSMDPTVAIVRVALDAQGEAVVEVRDPQAASTLSADLRVLAPTDMVLTPDESALVLAAPDEGVVVHLPLQRCGEGDPDCVEGQVDAENARAVPLVLSRDRLRASTASAAAPEPYAKLCGFERRAPHSVPLPDVPDEVMMTTPRPSTIAVDADCPEGVACTPRLLVSDTALPIIHALDLAQLAAGDTEAAVLEPLFTGVTTSAVAVTPWVPATTEEGGETQYVYAIDASDGSVLVLEQGELLSVSPNTVGRADRIGFNTSAGATALAVLTPDFDPQGPAEQWRTAEMCDVPQNPARLHGVFLAVALSDGTMRIVDVHDMELRDCRHCPNGDAPLLVRHQPRIEVTFPSGEDAEPFVLTPAQSMEFRRGGVRFPVRGDGTTGSPDAPGLSCIACAGDLVQTFPPRSQSDAAEPSDSDAGVDAPATRRGCGGSTPALSCADPNPWANDEPWFAVYEGLIPGTTGRIGTLIPGAESETGALELEPETAIDFCGAGVLGEDDIAAAFANQDCAAAAAGDEVDGDQLVILTPPLEAAQLRALEGDGVDPALVERCQALRDALEEEDAPPLGFEIRRAYRDRLILRSTLAYPLADVRRFEELAPCLERGLLAFDVRALGQFVVAGARSGHLHNVRESSTGRCVVDPDGDPLRQGRARFGCTYRNPSVQFRFARPEQDAPPAMLEFAIQPRSLATKLQMLTSSSGFGAVTVVGVQLRWNEIDNQLYLVDVHGRGLVPIPVNPMPRLAPPSYN